MNQQDLEVFEKLAGQIESVYDELSLLSKKSPSDAVNTFKLRFLNSLLAAANDLLGTAYRPFADFEQFDEDALPQNSDAVFILSQYLQCFEKLRADNVIMRNGAWHWVIEAKGHRDADQAGKIYVRTVRPKKLRE
jgi:hypothetical protein